MASFLIHTLPDPEYDVPDKEVAERMRQSQSGEVALISMADLREGVFADRRR